MAGVFQSFLAGKQAREAEQFRGLQMEQIKSDIRSRKAAAKQQQLLGEAERTYLSGDREAAEKQFMGLGKAGREALGGIKEFEEKERETAISALGRGYEVMKGLPEEQKDPARQAMIASAYGSGLLTEQEADQMSFLAAEDPDSFDEVAGRVLGVEAEEVGAVSGVISAERDGESRNFDLTDPEDRKEFIEGGWEEKPSKQLVGEITKKEAENLREAEISTKQGIATANEILEKLRTDPDAFTQAASLARVASGLANEVEVAARAAGVDIPTSVKEAGQYAGTFEELGIEGAVAQGLALDLALTYAAASGLGTGRALTNKDIDLALRRTGAGGLRTPEARIAALESVRDVLDRNFRIRYKTLKGKEYEGDLGIPKKATGGIPAPEGVSEGQVLIQNGIRYINRGGFMEPES